MHGGPRVAFAFALLTVLAFAVPASAKGTEPLSARANILWAQYTKDPSCCTTWMSTAENDPDFSGSGAYGFTSQVPTVAPLTSDVTWVMDLDPGLSGVVMLDAAKTIDFDVFIGNGDAGQVSVSCTLTLGGTTVAATDAKTATFMGDFKELTWQVSPAITSLDGAKGALEWTITASGVSDGTYVGFDAAHGHSHVTLPIAAEAVAANSTAPGNQTAANATAKPTSGSAHPTSGSSSGAPTASSTATVSAAPTANRGTTDAASGQPVASQSAKKSPGPSLLGVLALLGAAVALVRRRA